MKAGLLWSKWVTWPKLPTGAKAALLLVLSLWQTHVPAGNDSLPRHLRVERAVRVPSAGSGQTCAVLDADVYAHAADESLNDLRLFALDSGAETPFALTESKTERTESEPAEVRNVAMEGQSIGFDLEMPKRPYTAVQLLLDARNFVGSATVSARDDRGHAVALGEFTIYDMSAQHLARSTTLPLQESSFAELHVRLRLYSAPDERVETFGNGIVRGASVPPSRTAQTVYTAVAGTSLWTEHGRDSVATVRLPAHVPVARVRVLLDPSYKTSFLRSVTIAAKPENVELADSSESDVETVSGEISQVRLDKVQSRTAVAIDERRMAVDAVLAANLRGPANVEIVVANGNERPLPLRSVQMEMRERKICFEASASVSGYTLMYGDRELPAPVYDYSRVFVAKAKPVQATLGPEQANPEFAPRAEVRPFAVRHPDLLWLTLLAALAAFGGVARRSLRHRRGGLR